MRNFAANTIQAAMDLYTGMPRAAADKIFQALFEDDDALGAAIGDWRAALARLCQGLTINDPEENGPILFQNSVLVAIDAMLDARRADAYRKRAAKTDELEERQWLNEAADAAIAVAHQKALTVCAEAKAAAINPLDLAYMRSRLPVPGP
jgi:hypothetical protein